MLATFSSTFSLLWKGKSLYIKILIENTDEDSSILDLSAHITVKEIKEGIKSYEKGPKEMTKTISIPRCSNMAEGAIRCIQKVANQGLNQGRWV